MEARRKKRCDGLVVVENSKGKECVVGCVNNKDLLRLKPNYQELFNLLYEFGDFGVNSPNAGMTITDFEMPPLSQTTMVGTNTIAKGGFLTFTIVPNLDYPTPNPNLTFYGTDEGYILLPRYPLLITEFAWESDTEVELIFMSQPYADGYYDPNKVYPILDTDNRLMIVKGKSGSIRTSEYSSNIFVYASKACSVTMHMNAINPLVLKFDPVITEVPSPTNVSICGVNTPAAWSVLKDDEIFYTVAPNFASLASYVKNTIEYYSKPNPLLSAPSASSKTVVEPIIAIWTDIRHINFGGGTNRWMKKETAKDQYNRESELIASEGYCIGPLSNLYTLAQQYVLIQASLWFPLPPGVTYTEYKNINVSLLNPPGKVSVKSIKNKAGRSLVVNDVPPTLYQDGNLVQYNVSFVADSLDTSVGAFTIMFVTTTYAGKGIPSDSKWIVKATFPTRPNGEIPVPTVWNPFSQKIHVFTDTTQMLTPDPEYTVGNAFLLGGGGGSAAAILVNPGPSQVSISSGGGGRGRYVETGSLVVSKFNDVTKTYDVRPVTISVGKGGAGGNPSGVFSINGSKGGDTSIVYYLTDTSSAITTASGGNGSIIDGEYARTGPRGADDGGGGGTAANIKPNYLYAEGGAAGQGLAGAKSQPQRGGRGGDGPLIDYPGIVRNTRADGGPGSTSAIPSGGGAGGVLTIEHGQRAAGASGVDYTSPPEENRPGNAGQDGYAVYLSRYITF